MNLLALTGLINLIAATALGMISLLKSRKLLHFIWSFFVFTVAMWGLGIFKFSLASNEKDAIFWWKVGEIGVILMPAFLNHSIFLFLKLKKRIFSFFVVIIYIISFFYLILNLFTNIFFGEPKLLFGHIYYITPTLYYSFFLFSVFLMVVILDVFMLVWFYFHKKNKYQKKQIKYLIFAFIVGFSGGATSFFPVYGILIYPIYNISIFIATIILTYSLFKEHLLGMRVFLAHFLITSLNIVALIYIVFSPNKEEFLIRLLFFVSIILISFFLKQSFNKEIKQKEEIALFVKKLKQTNKKLEEIDRNKTEFISLASHQLRTPVTSIKGFISLANEGIYGKLDNNTKKLLKDIDSSANRLTNLIENLLNISRMEMGKLKYNIGLHSVCDILKELNRDFYAVAKEKGIKFKLRCLKDIKDKKIGIDKEKIKDVFSNLIDNAFKYTEKGSVSINVFQKEKNIRIEVKDTGMGIEDKDMPIIFDKFSRGLKSSNYNTSGLGIGIYLAKHIVEFHKGKIWAESKGKNKGSKFIVELPLKSELLEKIQKEKIQREVVDFLESI